MKYFSKKLFLIKLLAFFSMGISVSHADYVFTVEEVMEGGYDYSNKYLESAYDPNTNQETLQYTYEEVVGSEITYADFAIDEDDRVHAVVNVSGVGLQYVTNVSGDWTFISLAEDFACSDGDPKIKLDESGYAHVINGSSKALCYFTNVSGRWQYDEIGTGIKNGSGYSNAYDLAIDDSGKIHFVYANDENSLFYGVIKNKKSTPGWKMSGIFQPHKGLLKLDVEVTWTLLTSGTNIDPVHLAVHESDIDIVYVDQSDEGDRVLHHFEGDLASGSFSSKKEISDLGEDDSFVGLGIDHNDELSLWIGSQNWAGYGMHSIDRLRPSELVTKKGVRWKRESLIVGDLNAVNPRVVYNPLRDGVVLAAGCWERKGECGLDMWNQGNVEHDTIDKVGSFHTTSHLALALDKRGLPHAIYVDQQDSTRLKYAKVSEEDLSEEVDLGDIKDPAVALDSAGLPLIAYHQEKMVGGIENGDLKLAMQDEQGQWSVESLDESGHVGLNPSLAVGPSDSVYVSYYYAHDHQGQTQAKLKIATNCGGSWKTETVAGSGLGAHKSGEYSALVVDETGGVHMAYYDEDDGALLYATKRSCLSTSWTKETIDATAGADVGRQVHMAMDAGGILHLSYQDATNGHLKYAVGSLGSWESKTLDATDLNGEHNDIAVDGDGFVHISYSGETDQDLRYITNSSDGSRKIYRPGLIAGWSREVVDSSERTGWYNSIALTSQDEPVIGYYSLDETRLMLALSREGQWESVHLLNAPSVTGLYGDITLDAFDTIHFAHVVGGETRDLSYLTF